MGERPDAIAIREIWIRPVLEQQRHDGLMGRPALGQQDRLQQRRPSQPIHVVYVHVGLGQQVPHGLDLPAFGRRDEGDTAIAVRDRGVGPSLVDEPQDVQQSLRSGIQERVVELVVLEVHIGACGQEGPHRVGLAGLGRHQQRRSAGRIASVDVRAPRDGRRDRVQVAGLCGREQSVVHVLSSSPGAGAPDAREQHGHGRDHKRRPVGHLGSVAGR